MRIGLAIVDRATSWDRLTRHEKDAVLSCGLDSFSYRTSSAGAGDIFDEFRGAGIECRGHRWWTARSMGDVDAMAGSMARDCDDHLLSVFEINAESALWRGHVDLSGRKHANRTAHKMLNRFVTRFYEDTNGTDLSYLGYRNPAAYYLGGEPIAWETKRRFKSFSAMCYGSRAETITSKMTKAYREWSPVELNFWVGCGRIDRNGRVQGRWRETIEHTRLAPAGEVTLYVGNDGAWLQLARGNGSLEPTVIEAVRQYKRNGVLA